MAFVAPACSSSDDAATGGCASGTRDGDEVGVDCGGSCPTKCTGDECATGEQCTSGSCVGGECAAPAGKPCGVGVATSCADGQPCELDRDCTSGFCDAGKCATPPSESHSDGKKNGGETGVDCGGSVKDTKPCPDGEGCVDSADCVGTCAANVCGPAGPTDGKKNNGETDVDCGGPSAPPCASAKGCDVDTDCIDKYCPAAQKLCVEPRSDDGVKNGTETDVDCGGASGKKCAEAKACLVDADCVGACNYASKCVDAPSCKPKLGGDTCGTGEVGSGAEQHQSCCRSLPVPGFVDASRPGKAVYLDKYEITAGRFRAFIEAIAAQNGGAPNVKAWLQANRPIHWDNSFDMFLPGGLTVATESVPHKPTSGAETAPWFRNMGTSYQFNQQLYVYVHGHNCGNPASSYGYPTYWYPADVQALNFSLARADGFTGGGQVIPAKDLLDVKSMTCVSSAMLAAFCHWDGGQLATDEVLDFVTASPASLGSTIGCGTGTLGSATNRCAPIASIVASSDASGVSANYFYPYYPNSVNSEGVSRIASPGRVATDTIRVNAGDEPWQDIHGNVHEIALDVTGATFTGKFQVKYRGIGYSSARAGGNSPTGNLQYPEYRAGYSGGRCMRFK